MQTFYREWLQVGPTDHMKSYLSNKNKIMSYIFGNIK